MWIEKSGREFPAKELVKEQSVRWRQNSEKQGHGRLDKRIVRREPRDTARDLPDLVLCLDGHREF